jgi:hypothetical protein
MRKDYALGLAAIAFLALPMPVASGDKSAEFSCGVAYSVDAAGSVLLQHHGKFSLVDVAADATIQDRDGRKVSLAAVRRGDWIEYRDEQGSRVFYVNTPQRADCSTTLMLGQSR